MRPYSAKEVVSGSGHGSGFITNWIDMHDLGNKWMLWVSNDGPDTLMVTFSTSPDGTNPDMDEIANATCPVGRSVSVCGDSLHRFWKIDGTTEGTSNFRWGVMVERYPAHWSIGV